MCLLLVHIQFEMSGKRAARSAHWNSARARCLCQGAISHAPRVQINLMEEREMLNKVLTRSNGLGKLASCNFATKAMEIRVDAGVM